MSDARGWDEADRLRGVIRDVCSAMDPSGHVTAENVEQKAEEMRKEIERLRDTVHNYKALLAAAETAGREVCDERDIMRAGRRRAAQTLIAEVGAAGPEDIEEAAIRRLKADLLLLGALKSAEVAPVIERFREAFGADVPQAPSGERTTAVDGDGYCVPHGIHRCRHCDGGA